jgi:FAD/FMN-containing dehydrogenase
LITSIYYDPDMGAFAVESGATLGEVYRKLFLGWGVTIPAGISPNIGVGGHVLGGAFGYLCRQHGLAADHLYGVEVVVVDETGTARSVVATRDPSDPNRDLWLSKPFRGERKMRIAIVFAILGTANVSSCETAVIISFLL